MIIILSNELTKLYKSIMENKCDNFLQFVVNYSLLCIDIKLLLGDDNLFSIFIEFYLTMLFFPCYLDNILGSGTGSKLFHEN